MVRKYLQVIALKNVPKVFDGRIHFQSFSVKGTILCLGRFEFSGKISDRASLLLKELF